MTGTIQTDLITSAYFLYDVDEPSPTKNMRGVATAFSRRKQFITNGDASLLHIIEGSPFTELGEES